MRRLLFAACVVIAACTSSTDSTDTTPIPSEFAIHLQDIASGLASPVYLTSPPGDARLFVVELPGRIRIIQNGQLLSTPFLDISTQVAAAGERGMLSMAFHPQYKTNGFFYVYFTAPSGDIRVERFTVSSNANEANAASEKLILSVAHPLTNHNGGLAMFGPDGFLYLGLGDGGGGGDPNGNGQNRNSLLGKLLRIDVDHGDPYSIPPTNPFVGQTNVRQEIWAYGLRNPWRYAFDRTTGLLYVADVGQDQIEEVDIVAASKAGVNYGWNITEGSLCYNASSCNKSGIQLPVVEYTHAGGACSITGGFVYRGSALPEIAGHYFYSDYCLGFVKSFRYENGAPVDERTWDLGSIAPVLSFGEDASGELYVLSANGHVYKFVRA